MGSRRSGGRVYRETYTVRRPDGSKERRLTAWYYVRWRDEHGRSRKLKAAPTLAQAEEVLAKKLAEVADARAGIRRSDISKLRLDELLAGYLQSRAPHVTSKELRGFASILRRAFDAMKALVVADLGRERVEACLHAAPGGRATCATRPSGTAARPRPPGARPSL